VIFEQDAGDVARIDSALAQDVEEYEGIVRRSVSAGQLLTAIEVARDGMTRFGKTPVLQQQLALGLVQTGALDAAQEVLADLLKESARNEETLSLAGRVQKELWRRAQDPVQAAEALRNACTYYGEAFAHSHHYYPGINLAFALAAAGEFVQAEKIAREVADICRAEIKRGGAKADGWLLATLAEALVHQGETTEAAQLYRKAVHLFQGRWRDIASMRRQAREILRFQRERPQTPPDRWRDLLAIRRRARMWLGRVEEGEEWLDRCFEFPSVVVFSGHMIDQPGRAERFPPQLEPAVRDEIRRHLLAIKAGFGYSSLASGGDIIFCECLLEMEAKVNLVLPCSVEAFKRQSVSFAGPDWDRRFHHILANSTSCISPNPAELASVGPQAASAMGLVYANRIATGLAALQAQALDLQLQAIALWDGQPTEQPGGTASVVADWTRQKIRPHIIWPGATPALSTAPIPPPPAPVEPAPGDLRQEIKAMLFIDIVNFPRVTEALMPAFVRHFKGAIAQLMADLNCIPEVAETWAGIHYFVYDDVDQAARFALAVRDHVRQMKWADYGLPATLGVRMVLHAGPVFAFVDPTLRRETCAGSHVNRGARIAPMTPKGQVYVTQEFAALCGAEQVSAVSFEYLGYLRTTVMFEDAALYRLDWGQDDKKAAVEMTTAVPPAATP
jgi:class 3 adenylate cyclase/tetratricopeptide (TPR) repeat protein